METARKDNVLYVHHEQGYSGLSLFQQNVLNIVLPYITTAARLAKGRQDAAPFAVVDYGAADGVNSVPMIRECSDKLPPGVSRLLWIFNDLTTCNEAIDLQKVNERLQQRPGWQEGLVEFRYLPGTFYQQVVPDQTVDLGISTSAVHWLSHRPPYGCNWDIQNPDDITRQIAAKDWLHFLQFRAKELKEGGRLIIQTYVGRNKLCNGRHEKTMILTTTQKVIQDMWYEGVITEEEFDSARVAPITYRTEADLRAPFINPASDLSQSLNLINVDIRDMSDPFYQQWIRCGGLKDISATEEYVMSVVNAMKSFCNSFWKVLNDTRTKKSRLWLLEYFYSRLEVKVRENLGQQQLNVLIAVVEIEKIIQEVSI